MLTPYERLSGYQDQEIPLTKFPHYCIDNTFFKLSLLGSLWRL
jgi:hypothetical protein